MISVWFCEYYFWSSHHCEKSWSQSWLPEKHRFAQLTQVPTPSPLHPARKLQFLSFKNTLLKTAQSDWNRLKNAWEIRKPCLVDYEVVYKVWKRDWRVPKARTSDSCSHNAIVANVKSVDAPAVRRTLLQQGSASKTGLAQTLISLHKAGLINSDAFSCAEGSIKRKLQHASESHGKVDTPFGTVVKTMDFHENSWFSRPAWLFSFIFFQKIRESKK